MKRTARNTILEECWATHEAYRRLGIPASDIYVHVFLNVLVEARQGPLVFAIDIGVPHDRLVFVNQWREFAKKANEMCNTFEARGYYRMIYERSLAFEQSGSLVGSMVLKGFKIEPKKNLAEVV